jgi:hypothetical protein
VYPNLRRPSPRQESTDYSKAIQRLLGWEGVLLPRTKSYFSILVAERSA